MGAGGDSTLALDMTLTSALPGTVTFSRASTGTYFNSSGVLSSAAIDAARFNYNPATLAARGLLIEGARTNLLEHSEDFTNAVYVKANATTTANSTTAPDGTLTADTLTDNATPGVHQFFNATGSVANTTYASSIFAKAGTGRYLTVSWSSNTGNLGGHATFDLQGGVITQSGANSGGGTLNSAEITSVGNGWYRCVVVATNNTALTLYTVAMASQGTFVEDVVGRESYAGSGSTIFLWGAQVEAGLWATSYIPTGAAPVTRAADIGTMTGANFSDWYVAATGTFVVEFDVRSIAAGTRCVISADNNTANERIELYNSTADPKTIIVDGGATQADLDAGTLVADTAAKLGLSYAANDAAACLNGGAVQPDVTVTLPTPDRLRIGVNQAGDYLSGHVKSIKYYNAAKTDAELQSLTT
jgi:hypothetical protein